MVSLALPTLDDTQRLGSLLAGLLRSGDVVALEGSIGAGKTTLVRAVAGSLGVQEPVRSPTYTIAHEYALAGGGTLAHLDLYRDTSTSVAAWGDLEPYFDATYAMVEWPRAAEAWLQQRTTVRAQLAHAGGDARVARLSFVDAARSRAAADALVELVR